MIKKKQTEKEEGYSLKEVKRAEETMGNIMNQCSSEIWEVIEKFPCTPAMLYGILESIKLTIANDIYSTPQEDIHVCTDCKETIEKQIKNNPKKAKETQDAMYR